MHEVVGTLKVKLNKEVASPELLNSGSGWRGGQSRIECRCGKPFWSGGLVSTSFRRLSGERLIPPTSGSHGADAQGIVGHRSVFLGALE